MRYRHAGVRAGQKMGKAEKQGWGPKMPVYCAVASLVPTDASCTPSCANFASCESGGTDPSQVERRPVKREETNGLAATGASGASGALVSGGWAGLRLGQDNRCQQITWHGRYPAVCAWILSVFVRVTPYCRALSCRCFFDMSCRHRLLKHPKEIFIWHVGASCIVCARMLTTLSSGMRVKSTHL